MIESGLPFCHRTGSNCGPEDKGLAASPAEGPWQSEKVELSVPGALVQS